MTTEVWLAIIACITAVIGLVKYLVTKLSDSNEKAILAHQRHLETFQKEIKEVRKNYYDTVAKIESVKAQMISVQQGSQENNKQLKRFIELTQTYIQDSEKRMRSIEDDLGKIIKVGK